jgi:hypothetical protein
MGVELPKPKKLKKKKGPELTPGQRLYLQELRADMGARVQIITRHRVQFKETREKAEMMREDIEKMRGELEELETLLENMEEQL